MSTGVSNVEGPNSETVALQDEDDDFIGDDFSGDLPETSKRLPAVPVSCTPDSSSESRLGHSCSTTSFASWYRLTYYLLLVFPKFNILDD